MTVPLVDSSYRQDVHIDLTTILRFSFLARAREDTQKRVFSVEEVQRAI